jgi:hypothetical protein
LVAAADDPDPLALPFIRRAIAQGRKRELRRQELADADAAHQARAEADALRERARRVYREQGYQGHGLDFQGS